MIFIIVDNGILRKMLQDGFRYSFPYWWVLDNKKMELPSLPDCYSNLSITCRRFWRAWNFSNRFKQVVFELSSYLKIKIINQIFSIIFFNPLNCLIASEVASEVFIKKLTGKSSMKEFMLSNAAGLSTG